MKNSETFQEVVAMCRMGFYPRSYMLEYEDDFTPSLDLHEDPIESDEPDFLEYQDWVLQNVHNPDLVGKVTIGIVTGARIGAWVTLGPLV